MLLNKSLFSRLLPGIFLFILLFGLSLEGQQIPNRKKYNIYSSEERKFVWCPVFKVASTTIYKVLTREVSDIVQSQPKNIRDDFEHHFKFSFVRNPWDRILSCYFSKVVTKRIDEFAVCFDKDFEHFVDYIATLDVSKTNRHITAQTKLIPVKDLDFIGKLENFEHDFKYVCDVIGVTLDEVPHKNKTEHAHYSTYYTPRTRDIIAEKYKDDIETFGFSFEQR